MMRCDLVAIFAEAAAETVPQELLDFMAATGGGRARDIAFGMLTAIWAQMRKNGDFETLAHMAAAIAADRAAKAGAS